MPHVSVKLYAGQSDDAKQRLVEAVAAAVRATVGSSDASISVSVEDIEPAQWREVYHRDIAGNPHLKKAPGYPPPP
ncbi:MAG TPA: tautomerase family protein [Myxococcota bacterium]